MIRAKLFRGLRNGTMAIGSLYDDERLKLIEEPACVFCEMIGPLTIDHLIPRAAGGGDDGDNLVRACRPCNSSKGKRDLLAWYDAQGLFPRLMLLRRYLKLVAVWCERAGLLDVELQDARLRELPFEIARLPAVFPRLAELNL